MEFRDLIRICQEQIMTHRDLGAGILELRILIPARAKDSLRTICQEESSEFICSESITEVIRILGVEVIYTEQDTFPLVLRLATL